MNMVIFYNYLWKMLIDINMYKKDLATELNISSVTMAKTEKGENVSMYVLERICSYMNCVIGDIIGFKKIDREKVPSNSSK